MAQAAPVTCLHFDVVARGVMGWGILAMRTHQDVRINCDHPPRSSYASSHRRSQDVFFSSDLRPFPLKPARRSRKFPACRCSAMMRRRPSSTSALKVVLSRAASLRAWFKIGSGISMVVLYGYPYHAG